MALRQCAARSAAVADVRSWCRAHRYSVDCMSDADPEPDAYGRVTNPGRYQVLHDVAERLLGELARNFAVSRSESLVSDPSRSSGQVRMVQLDPAHPGVGVLRVTFTGFPGLMVKLGQESETALPACGCDACDEDPQELIEELHHKIGRLTRAGSTESARWRRRLE
ncbi:DUF6226 family protein [Actinoplanes cyaneus]|nr:DUF6226 family protein [Actinoplanes cyaneus]